MSNECFCVWDEYGKNGRESFIERIVALLWKTRGSFGQWWGGFEVDIGVGSGGNWEVVSPWKWL